MLSRLAILICAFGFSPLAQAADVASGAFGVPAGIYRGAGTAISTEILVPNVDFVSLRKLENGVITAKTRASFWGMQIADVGARLRIVRDRMPNHFVMLDLDRNSQPCGSAVCTAQDCTFSVVVMNGALSLKETWVPTADGFALKQGSQVFNGLSSTYESQFTRTR